MTHLRLEAGGSVPNELELADPNPGSLKLDASDSRLVGFVAGLALRQKVPLFGQIVLNLADGELASWEIRETGRLPAPKQGSGAVLKLVS